MSGRRLSRIPYDLEHGHPSLKVTKEKELGNGIPHRSDSLCVCEMRKMRLTGVK